MLTLTDPVKEKLREHLAARPDLDLAIRLSVIGRGRDSFRYDFRTAFRAHRAPDDVVIEGDGFQLFVDAGSDSLLEGAVLDVSADGQGFKIDNPNPVWNDPKGPQVLAVIEQVINPGLAMHGGRINLVDVRDGVVYVSFGGGCQGCGMVNMTLSEGVRKLIKEAIPDIHDIVDVTKHSLGTNPFFSPVPEKETATDKEP
jgi:Fe/S biogenesis protein NfuA